MSHRSETRLPEIHQWLVTAGCWRNSEDARSGASLAIEQFGVHTPALAARLARHLRSYDGKEREWFDFDVPLVDVLAGDYASLCLLGRQGGDLTRRELIAALVQSGHVVIEGAGVLEATGGSSNVFRVALLPDGSDPIPQFHLAADPGAFSSSCLVAVIGDAFLEWLNCRDSRINPLSG